MSYKTIKDVTQLTGTTEKALRYYDQRNLLHPTVKRDEGRREWLYDQAAIKRLRRILLYRQVGFSVDEIARLLEGDQASRTSILSCKVSGLQSERHVLDNQISVAGMLLMAERMGVDEVGYEMLGTVLREIKANDEEEK